MSSQNSQTVKHSSANMHTSYYFAMHLNQDQITFYMQTRLEVKYSEVVHVLWRKDICRKQFPSKSCGKCVLFFSSSHLHKRDGDLLETRPRLI